MTKPEFANSVLASPTNIDEHNHHYHHYHNHDRDGKPEFANRVLASPTDGDKFPPEILSVFPLHLFPSLLHIVNILFTNDDIF